MDGEFPDPHSNARAAGPLNRRAAAFALQENSGSGLGNAFAGGAAFTEDVSGMWSNAATLSKRSRMEAAAALHIITPEIKFRDIPHTPWIDTYIGKRLQRLDRYAGGITSCHVTLARDQTSHHKGNAYSCMVEVRLPPQHDLAATKRLGIKNMRVQLPALINQAFGAIESQLRKTVSLRRGDTKSKGDGRKRRDSSATLEPGG